MTGDELFNHMSGGLGLTEAQKTRIRPYIDGQQRQIHAVNNDFSLSATQKAERRKQIRENTRKGIFPHLTPQQQQKYEKSRQIREKMQLDQ